jgi:long-chain-alcohol oxidase
MPASGFRFSDRQRASLAAIVDTFAPGVDGLPSGSEHGVVEVIEEAVASNPRKAERRQVAQLLGLWNTRLLTAIGGGGFDRFGELPQSRREDVLRSWRDSRTPQRRGAYQALRKAALLMYYMKPGPDGRTSPMWERAGFPGPPGPREDAAAPALTPIVADRDMDLRCDVVVVGSGAGGGPAAAVLAGAGLDVVVLEAGDYVPETELDGSEFQGYSSLYLNGGAMSSQDGGTGILAGATLGGGTTVNYTTAYRTPGPIRDEWARAGAEGVDGDEFDRCGAPAWGTRTSASTSASSPPSVSSASWIARFARGRACCSRSTWTSSRTWTEAATACASRRRRSCRASSSRSRLGTARCSTPGWSSRSRT